jgi:hypothetical protein
MIFIAVYTAFAVFLAVAAVCAAAGPERGRRLLAVAVFAATAAMALLSLFATGVLFDAKTYLGDLWTAFEAINKAEHGLRSSLDYFSPIGPAHDWIYAAAIALRGASASTIPVAGGLAALMAVALGLVMLGRRVSMLGLSLALFAAVTTAVSPREIDAPFFSLTLDYLAPYNRWAWALFIPVALRLAVPTRDRDLAGAVAAGLAIAVLLMLKITYGAAALGLLGLAAVLQVERWREVAVTLVAMLAALTAAELLTGQVTPYVSDLAMAARMESNGLRILELVAQSGEMALACLLGLFFLAMTVRDEDATIAFLARPAVMILAVGGAGGAVLMQNHYKTEAALYCILPLIAVEWTGFLAQVRARVGERRAGTREATMLIALALVVLRPGLIDAGSLIDQQVEFLQKGVDPKLAGTPGRDLRVHPQHTGEQGSPCSGGTCKDYARMISGLAMLREAGAGRDNAGAVLALNFSNPFPFLLDRPSPTASPIWLHHERSFSEATHIPPETLFAGVGYVMIGKSEPNAARLEEIYEPYLGERYAPAAENESWRLLITQRSPNE